VTDRAERGTRRRLSAGEARERILEAAERRLAEVGPEGLRLTELAAELGISHPAILHHFGSREALVAAVVQRAFAALNDQLLELVAQRGGRRAIVDALARFFGEHGQARLLAWLILSGRAASPQWLARAQPLRRLIDLAHRQRLGAQPGREIDLADTRFRSQLTAFAMLGEAVFGDLIRSASGDATGAEASRDFRRRLAQLLADTAR
jgi:AcrR family transcriptional regulator